MSKRDESPDQVKIVITAEDIRDLWEEDTSVSTTGKEDEPYRYGAPNPSE